MPNNTANRTEKKKCIKNHKMWLAHSLDASGDYLNVELKYGKSLLKLCRDFAVMSEPPTPYAFESISRNRYLIKRILTSDDNWSSCYSKFFDKDLLDNGTVTFKMYQKRSLRNLYYEIDGFKRLVALMEESNQSTKVKFEYAVMEG